MGPMGPRGLGPIKTKRKEGPDGRKDRADGRKRRTGGRKDRTEGPDGRTPPTPHPPKKSLRLAPSRQTFFWKKLLDWHLRGKLPIQ